MVSKIPPRAPAVNVNDTVAVKVQNRFNNDDEELFEFGSETKCSDTYHTSSVKKSVNADDGKISTGEFWSEYLSGSWDELKRQGNELIETVKKHPVLATGAVLGTVAAVTFSPVVAGTLGAISLGFGVYELIKDVKNGIKAYNNYKNAKTDADAKKQVRDMGANTVNVVEDATMTLLGGRQVISSAKRFLPKFVKWIKKTIKPPRFDLDKNIRLRVKRSVTDNALLIARTACCNSDDALNASSIIASHIESGDNKQRPKYSSLTSPPEKKQVKK